MRAERGHVLAPASRHEGVQFGWRAVYGVNVAVDDLQSLGRWCSPDGDIHWASLSPVPGACAITGVAQAGIGIARIVYQDLAYCVLGQTVRQDVVGVELPVGIV